MKNTKKSKSNVQSKKNSKSILTKIFYLPSKIFELEQGRSIQNIIGWLLRLGSAGIAIGVIKTDYNLIAGLSANMPASNFISELLSIIGISSAGYIGTGLLYLRAGRILKEPSISDYPMLFLFAEIVQIFSEILGVMIIIISTFAGVMSAIYNAMGDYGAYGFAPLLSGLYGWASLYYLFAGLALLVLGHAFRDFLKILIRIEKNTR